MPFILLIRLWLSCAISASLSRVSYSLTNKFFFLADSMFILQPLNFFLNFLILFCQTSISLCLHFLAPSRFPHQPFQNLDVVTTTFLKLDLGRTFGIPHNRGMVTCALWSSCTSSKRKFLIKLSRDKHPIYK